jgi:beta-N-acetylhexosaminidase
MGYKAIIVGVNGLKLTDEERDLFATVKPLGFILFKRNVLEPKQLKQLVKDLRLSIGNPSAPILIDQEGGRVARLRSPHWYSPPAASVFGQIAENSLDDAIEACKLNTYLIARDLVEAGINVDCAPLVDVPIRGADNVIGDRAFDMDKKTVTTLAQTMADGFIANGITPIMKHIPGHGRAPADSHLALPVVHTDLATLRETDFYPFMNLCNIAWAMTAHVIYTSIDPSNPATHSRAVIKEIRDTIGFQGLIITDCITMDALSGSMLDRAVKSIEAGCDIVLYSRFDPLVIKEMALALPDLTDMQMELVLQSVRLETQVSDAEAYCNKLNDIFEQHNITFTAACADPTDR